MIAEQIRKFFSFMKNDLIINKSNSTTKTTHKPTTKAAEKPNIGIWRNLYNKRGSCENHLVARCMEFLAKSVSSVTIRPDVKNSNTQHFHLLSDLLNEPNQYNDQISFIETIVFSMLRTGFAYVVIDFRKDRIEMTCIDPSLVKPQFIQEDLSGFIINGQTVDKKLVISIRDTGQSVNLLHNGRSKCDLVKPFIYIMENIINHNSALIINTPKLNGIISLKDPVSRQNQEEIKESIEDKFYNHSCIPVVTQGIKWTENQYSRELDYTNSYNFLKEQVMSIFGIPCQLMSHSGYGGYNTSYSHARKHWFEDEVLPMARRILAALEKGLNIFFQALYPHETVKLTLDISEVPGLSDANNASQNKVFGID